VEEKDEFGVWHESPELMHRGDRECVDAYLVDASGVLRRGQRKELIAFAQRASTRRTVPCGCI